VVGAAAPAFGWLVASRVLLGIGTSAAYPRAMALRAPRRPGWGGPSTVLLVASVLIGLPQGPAGTSNQAAVAAQAPPGGVGAAGLQRASQYLGAITASSLIALRYGHRTDDAGLHLIALAAGVLSLGVRLLTVTDRALHGRS
jgi:hypothetical protein